MPSRHNARAIRAYEKAGFARSRLSPAGNAARYREPDDADTIYMLRVLGAGAVAFSPLGDEAPGTIAALLRASYAGLLRTDPQWEDEAATWDAYDREVFDSPKTVGACLFLTRLAGRVAGFASWDPRGRPAHGSIGHNCILPELRRRGLGKLEIEEVLRRFQELGVRTAKVSTCDHPFFVPAQRMYLSCGFRETRRGAWERDPSAALIRYERRLP
ncbi:MAG: GNAT family N-acetyltransferase [Candidatus Bipolaricaulota bacterium]